MPAATMRSIATTASSGSSRAATRAVAVNGDTTRTRPEDPDVGRVQWHAAQPDAGDPTWVRPRRQDQLDVVPFVGEVDAPQDAALSPATTAPGRSRRAAARARNRWVSGTRAST